ncbi:MAG: hypothetical protein EA427_04260 [Spirochaetaceae bacterium]|nr:MAG: hypothetical protein EA427_04260 [Spirochaetaceae bacterium]
MVAGDFFSDQGLLDVGLVRMSQSGEINTSFAPTFDDTVLSLQVLEIDGVPVLLAGGFFTEVNGQERIGIAVLNMDGTLRPEFARLFPDVFSAVFTILPVPERGTVLLAGNWEDVYESPGDAGPTTDGRYASLVEVEWPGGAVRQSFLAGETLDFGNSLVRGLAPGFGESGWTVAVAGSLIFDAATGAPGAILNQSGELVAFTQGVSGTAFSITQDVERGRYVFSGDLEDGFEALALLEYSVVPFERTRAVSLDDLDFNSQAWTTQSLPGGRVFVGGKSLFFPETAAIVIEPEGGLGSFSGEIGGGEVQRSRTLSSGIYLGGTFFDFRVRDLISGSVSEWIPANGLVRLRHDLTLDTSFVPTIGGFMTDIVELPPGTP